MFSITTIELSTNIPMPSARPDREIMFSDIFEKYISTIAKMTLNGMEQAITIVGLISFKKTISTRTANNAPKIIFCNTDSTTISMYTP